MTTRLRTFILTALLATIAASILVAAADRTFTAWVRERILALWRASGSAPSPRSALEPEVTEVPPIPSATPRRARPTIRGRLVPWPLDGEDPVGTVNGESVAPDGTFAVPVTRAGVRWLWLEWKGGVAWCQEVEHGPRGRDLGIVWLPSPARLTGRVEGPQHWLERKLVVRVRCAAPVVVRAEVAADGTFDVGPLPPGPAHAAIWHEDRIVGPITEWPEGFASAPPLELYCDERRDVGVVHLQLRVLLPSSLRVDLP